jgi:hypothetical protein
MLKRLTALLKKPALLQKHRLFVFILGEEVIEQTKINAGK